VCRPRVTPPRRCRCASQLPTDTPLAFVSVKPVPGWTATTETTPLDPPVTVEGTEITEAVSRITWTADPGAGIKPGEYQSFSISAGPLPDGDSLALPAIQGYDDGTEVAWVEPTVEGHAEPEHPAPTLSLAAASDDAATPEASTTEAASSDSGTSGLAVTALIVGIVGLLAGIAGVVLALGARRRAPALVASASERERESANA
jgi:periplasmic copper chaperone A